MESGQYRLEFEANSQIVVPSTGDDRGLLSPVGPGYLSTGQIRTDLQKITPLLAARSRSPWPETRIGGIKSDRLLGG